ncbi:hypothetical protein [Saccharococcus caldoxylosilyticus]|jgi:hypothetical protein|uniref:Uncharacterized protein n=2 Tax=Saccharococcus caldoxylosilyticus TaxID=81408 RepID=A0A023DCV0_9BACL|nr:hypothetical protein [Parageobacillus caldoxylosilyticus]OQO98506.1 hypothetical protein BSK33_17165 [Geobacillus sp. 44B]KYD07544.1 hypothetical protein B4119_4323 [Parageobacillus caldoxylosilyticus]MBB3851868.1 hypothetical protein [Parageobacillus caldoxylosilyticus]QNU39228.1 hypothetical protein IC801_08810 [Geobacillus sp. 44B]QXJ39075.1 hypothetical protein BV455_02440 [Parageobacillus caldoxylosilyticus]
MIEESYGHWHLDYYQEQTGFYTSATGFWNDDEGNWEVFFNEFDNNKLAELFGTTYEIDKDFGALIFKARNYDEAHKKFIQWVEDILLPLLDI